MSISDPCCAGGVNRFFSKSSDRYLRKFRKNGLGKEQRLLADAISRHGIAGKTILDIGCGVGSLHMKLLQGGATSATGIDIAEKMIENAKTLAHELGLSDKVRLLTGDFVDTNGSIQSADIVILDKVVCCYANLDLLLARSLGKSTTLYALSYPRNRFLSRCSFSLLTLLATVFRWSFRPYWHDWAAMEKTIERAGFRPGDGGQTLFWKVLVWQRTTAGS